MKTLGETNIFHQKLCSILHEKPKETIAQNQMESYSLWQGQ